MSNTYLFNPDNDLALANGDANYQSPLSARKMAYDLSTLPIWYASANDSILIPDSTILYYREQNTYYNHLCPKVNWITARENIPQQPISPWGWNPALIKQLTLRNLAENYLPDTENMVALRSLSGREFAVTILRNILSLYADTFHPITGESFACYNEDEVKLRVESFPKTLLKAPWSSSGKGLRKGEGEYVPPLSGWCVNTLSQQKCIIVEPLYDKFEDFAMEFYSAGNEKKITFIGYSFFRTDHNGAYKSNELIPDTAIEKILSQYITIATLHSIRTSLIKLISAHVSTRYKGYIGVDMMICKEHNTPHYRLHPCVEINMRMNMGVVAHHLYNHYISPQSQGIFSIEYQSKNEKLQEVHAERIKEYPLILTPDNRIHSGYLNLTPVSQKTNYCAYIEVF